MDIFLRRKRIIYQNKKEVIIEANLTDVKIPQGNTLRIYTIDVTNKTSYISI